MSNKRAIFGGVASVFLVILTISSCSTVGAGNRGVKVVLGEVQKNSLHEGLYFTNPVTTSIVEMSTRVRKWSAKTAAYTRDIQQADVQFTVTYRLQPDAAPQMYQSVGEEWWNALVPQVVTKSIKDEFGRWNAVNVISERGKLSVNIQNRIAASLRKKNVILDGFEITNIDYSDAFEGAVESKEVAVQKAIEETNRTKQVEERAKQQLISAKAEAESMRIRSAALEQNARLVEYEAVQKWNGELPQYMLGNGALPFIPVK